MKSQQQPVTYDRCFIRAMNENKRTRASLADRQTALTCLFLSPCWWIYWQPRWLLVWKERQGTLLLQKSSVHTWCLWSWTGCRNKPWGDQRLPYSVKILTDLPLIGDHKKAPSEHSCCRVRPAQLWQSTALLGWFWTQDSLPDLDNRSRNPRRCPTLSPHTRKKSYYNYQLHFLYPFQQLFSENVHVSRPSLSCGGQRMSSAEK